MKYKDDELKKLQETEIEILRDVARVCEENNIQFFSVGGTAPCYNLGQKGKEIPDRKLLAYRIDREPLPPCVVSVRGSPFGEG